MKNSFHHLLGGFAVSTIFALSALGANGLQANGTVVGTNQITGTAPVVATLGNTTFTNYGLEGVGRYASNTTDAWGDTLGSMSGMQVLNWAFNGTSYSGSFMTLPDRGYNSGTIYSDYAARVNVFDFVFTPYTGVSNTTPTQLALSYNATSSYKFTYFNGTANITTTGLDPGSNTTTLFGKTEPFAINQLVQPGNTPVAVNKLPLDSEALVLKSDGSGYIGDEYGANIYYFNSAHQIVGVITPPAAIQPHSPAGNLNFDSVNTPVDGRRNNQGMEGVALSPDGTHLFGLMQSATVQDSLTSNDETRHETRLLVYDVSGNATPGTPVGEYVLQLPIYRSNGNPASNPNKTAAQSEIIALDDHRLLVLSRDGNGYGTGSTNPEVFKSVLLVDLSGATNILGSFDAEGNQISPGGVLNPSITPITWVEAVNMLNTEQLAKFGMNVDTSSGGGLDSLTLSEKWEAMALLPAMDASHPDDYFLFIGNDNDFLTASGFMQQADGSFYNYNTAFENYNTILAYRVSISPPLSVPEPSTCAIWAGGAVLALAIWRRRVGLTK